MMTSENKWVYKGTNSKGKRKFRIYTDDTKDDVINYLNKKGIAYVYHPKASMFFIYKEKEPKDEYAPRYAYYYTTGMWGNDTRSKHYYSKGIEHFIETYYETLDETKKYWESKT